MTTDPEQRTMPGAFFSDDELPAHSSDAQLAITAQSHLRDEPRLPHETTRHRPMEIPIRLARPVAPTTAILARISPIPQVTPPPAYSNQRREQPPGSEERRRQHDEGFLMREKDSAKRERLSRQQDDEVWRQQDELFRSLDEEMDARDEDDFGEQHETPNFRGVASESQMRSMPGSFDNDEEYDNSFKSSHNHSNNFTSPAELPSQRQFDSEYTPYRHNLHILDPSSHYSLLLNGRIGNSPDITVRRAPSTRISQNVGLASAALRRNPTRKENLEMSPNLAGNWLPDLDPWVAGEVVRANPTPPRTPKGVTPRQTMLMTAAGTSATPAPPASATQKPATTTPKKAKSPKPKPAAALISRDEEHKSHIDKLASLEATKRYWSQIGAKFDVKYETLSPSIQSQLSTSTKLGAGHFGTVQRVVCGGVPLAQKTIRPTHDISLASITREVNAVKELSGHHHIIQLVGTYITQEHGQDVFHILTFPVADCDMDTYLKSYEASLSGCDAANISALSTASGLSASAPRYIPLSAQLATLLKQTLGCITSAIRFMHLSKISHDDIKPANVLLRHGQIYLTDFGISRDRSAATQTSTEFFPGFTYGWTAPEKEAGEVHNPFKADIYSLGCIFFHVISLLSGQKKIKDCAEILNRLPSHREEYIEQHFRSFFNAQWSDGSSSESHQQLIALTVEMLLNGRQLRPKIEDVNERLLTIGGGRKMFHGACCHLPQPEGPPQQTQNNSETELDPMVKIKNKNKTKEVFFLRHKLQKCFLSKDQQPNKEDIKMMSEYIRKLDEYEDLEATIIRTTKIIKVLRDILKLESIPKEEEYMFKKRSQDLLDKWAKILEKDTEAHPPDNVSRTIGSNGVAKLASDLGASRTVPQPLAQPISPRITQSKREEAPAEDDDLVTITPATLRQRAEKQPIVSTEMPADEMV